MKPAKTVLFIIFLIAFGLTFHGWAGALLRADGTKELLASRGQRNRNFLQDTPQTTENLKRKNRIN